MKRIWIWLRVVFVFWLLNLLFLGFVIGQSFEDSPIKGGVFPSITYQNRSTMRGIKIFTRELTGASKRVLSRLNNKWRDVMVNVTYPSQFGFVNMFNSKKKILVGEKTDKAPVVREPIKEIINNEQRSNLEANIPIQLDSIIPDLPQNWTVGRPDPFLDIVAPQNISKSQSVKKDFSEIKTTGETEGGNKPDLQIALKDGLVKTNPLSNLRLRGIVEGETRVAYLEDQSGYHKVTTGTPIAGGRVIDITKGTVTIQIGNQQIVFTEEGSK